MEIDWLSDASHVLLNPRMPAGERARLESLAVDLPGHLWLATSGTSGALKLAALSKRAMLASAAAVNRRLRSDASDVWLAVLPTFHVGGLGIHARAFLSGARVVTEWSDEVTLASLVPAQVSDLLSSGARPPRLLRAVIVGGGALTDELYTAGWESGWPLLPSYGMTETCSQVATAQPGSPELVLLDHVEARVEDGRLAFRGESLFSGYGTDAGFVDPKTDGWFVSDDLGSVEGGVLRPLGRMGEFVKIGGESVDLSRLDGILVAIAGPHAAVAAIPDPRLGHVIHLFMADSVDADLVVPAFNERVHPFERPRQIHVVDRIPRTALGKLIRKALVDIAVGSSGGV